VVVKAGHQLVKKREWSAPGKMWFLCLRNQRPVPDRYSIIVWGMS
jgi:hypothetical protein